MSFQLADFSNNNPTPHWQAVKSDGIAGVWLKVSEGTGFIDQTWQSRSEAARAAGLRVGGYHFARPGAGTAIQQAGLFTRALGKLQPDDLRPVLDLEDTGHLSSAALRQWVRAFNQEVVAAVTAGPLLYSYTAFLKALGWASPAGYGLWLADYGPDNGTEHPVTPPAPWKRVVAHQYTSRGTLAGVAGYVDRSSAPSLNPLLAHPPQV